MPILYQFYKSLLRGFWLLVLCLWSASLGAQTQPEPQIKKNWILNTPESTTKSYIAGESIKLQSGSSTNFSFKAETGKSFSAKIDPGLLFPPNDKTYAVTAIDGTVSYNSTNGAVVGSIPGQFNVSPTGAATYTIPIEVPTGINGMQPSVSLVYNSQGGNGIAGWGWNIGGLSMISRVPKNHYYDNEKSGMIWDNTSPLALDGQRLIEIQRWSTDSVEYDTEAKSGNRIVGYNIKNWGAEYFKVYTKSGQIIQYGSTQNLSSYFPFSGTPENYLKNLCWAITNVDDNNKNTIKFQYIHDVIQTGRGPKYLNNRIEKILYGGNISKNKENDIRIEFEYNNIDTENIVTTYIDGNETTSNKILKQITVFDNNNLQKTYIPQYETVNHKYQLTNINLMSADSEKISSSTFDWSDNLYEYNAEGSFVLNHNSSPKITQAIQNGYNNNLSYLGRSWGDVDGDGDQDVLMKYKLEKRYFDNWLDELFDVYSYDYKYFWVIYKNNAGNFAFLFDNEYNDRYSSNYNSFQFIDKDNDGKEELYCGGKMQNDRHITWYGFDCYVYSNNSVYSSSINSFEMPKQNYGTSTVIAADFLGKGEPQHMGFKTDENNVFKPVDFSESDVYVEDIVDAQDRSDVYISDFNGNGKSELVYVHDDLKIYEFKKDYWLYDRGGSQYYNRLALVYTHSGINHFDKVLTGDFNGDGNTDFLIQDYPSYSWKFLISTGTSLVEKNYSAGLTIHSNVKILDVNKDGKSDILNIEPIWVNNVSTQSNIVLQISNGNGFEQKLSQIYSGSLSGFDANGKVNSDKYDDIIMSFQYQSEIFNISNNIQFNKIVGIKDQLNNSNTIEYDLYNSNKIKDFQSGIDGDNIDNIGKSVFATNKGSWDIVTGLQYHDANANLIESTSYKYGEAIIHKTGKGLLGYNNDTITNNINSLQKINKKEFNSSFVLLLPDSEIVKKINATNNISETISKYSIEAILNRPKAYILKQTELYSKDYLSTLESTTEYLEYDNWLNPKSIKTTKGGLVENQTISYIQKGAWCPNKPEIITSTTKYNGDSISHKKVLGYDAKGNLTSETINPDDDKFKTITEYTQYDVFGHPEIVKVTARDKNKAEHTRTSTVKYKANGRYVDYKINLFGEKTTYSYDESKGLLKSETMTDDANKWSKTTSYSYDNWWKLKETRYPDGNRETSVLQWAGGSGPSGAIYYSYSQTSGNAPVTVWYDGLGREIQKDTYGLNNKKISVSTEYYTTGADRGKLYRVSEPYFENETKTWATTYDDYDEYGRVIKVTTRMGESITDYNEAMVTKVTTPEGTQSSKINSSGFTEWTEVNGKKVNFDYYPNGLTKTSTPQGGTALAMEYNVQGKRTKLTDPDAGIIETVYNGFGELEEERQLIHKNATSPTVTVNNYDYSTGLLNNINRNGEVTEYTYDTDLGYKGRIKSIKIATDRHIQEFTYDNHSRVTNVKESLKESNNTKVFNTGTQYDALGRVKKETYPTGYYTVNTYDNYGNLIETKDGLGRQLWKAVAENARGQLTEALKGGRSINYGFDNRGLPETIKSGSIVDMKFHFDAKTNLEYRIDNVKNQSEYFEYDALNRLKTWTPMNGKFGGPTISIDYNALGNITKKGDLDNYTLVYGEGNGKPHALTSISGVPTSFPQPNANFPLANLDVTYTDFKKIKKLEEMGKTYELTYGVDDQRRKSVYKENGVTKLTCYYVGDYEEEIDALGNVKQIHYLSGAILIRANGVETLYYSYTDYQGSLIALTDESGNVVERYAYDPWGARRNPNNWTESDSRTSWIINRGYTGHEHLDAFGIINMNGRVYDPLTAMFFSPDPYVQTPDNWLNYNRYGYAFGNPFRYTDPSGEFFYIIPGISWSKSGGLSVSLSIGFGLPGAASIGVTFGYGFANNNFSASINGSLGGGYLYAGFDTKGGGMAGAGFGFGNPALGVFSTNLMNVGVNYSQNGGWSANYMGINISKNGTMFDPSIGASMNISIYQNKYITGSDEVVSMSESCFKTENQAFKSMNENGFRDGSYGIDKFSYVERPKSSRVGGVTKSTYVNGKLTSLSIKMYPHRSVDGFYEAFNHELIHAYDHVKYGQLASSSYRETKAYRYTDRFRDESTMPSNYSIYNGSLDLMDIPNYLVPTATPALVQPNLYPYLPKPARWYSPPSIHFSF